MKKTVGLPSVVIYPNHCSALPIQSCLVLHSIYNPQTLKWFPYLYSRKPLATCMPERTLLLVINISQRLQTKTFCHLLCLGQTLKRYFPDTGPQNMSSSYHLCIDIQRSRQLLGVKFSFLSLINNIVSVLHNSIPTS